MKIIIEEEVMSRMVTGLKSVCNVCGTVNKAEEMRRLFILAICKDTGRPWADVALTIDQMERDGDIEFFDDYLEIRDPTRCDN